MPIDIIEEFDSMPPATPVNANDNLALLVDIYKHHWDLFLKGFALYLAACTIFATIASQAETKVDIFQQIFCGVAVTGASIVAFIGLRVSIKFLTTMGTSIDEICTNLGYSKIYFNSPRKIMVLFSWVTVVLASVGVLYVVYLAATHGWAPAPPAAS